MEERQILIEHITSLEQQLNIEEDDGCILLFLKYYRFP